MGGRSINAPVVGMAADPATGGYWEVGSDGGIYAFGAPFYGSEPGAGAVQLPVVGLAALPSGGGYEEVDSGQQLYSFGAPFI